MSPTKFTKFVQTTIPDKTGKYSVFGEVMSIIGAQQIDYMMHESKELLKFINTIIYMGRTSGLYC